VKLVNRRIRSAENTTRSFRRKAEIRTQTYVNCNSRYTTRKISLAVFFLLGDSPASEFYVPTFRYTLPVPSSLGGIYTNFTITHFARKSHYLILPI